MWATILLYCDGCPGLNLGRDLRSPRPTVRFTPLLAPRPYCLRIGLWSRSDIGYRPGTGGLGLRPSKGLADVVHDAADLLSHFLRRRCPVTARSREGAAYSGDESPEAQRGSLRIK